MAYVSMIRHCTKPDWSLESLGLKLTQATVDSLKGSGRKQRFPDNKVRGLALRIAPGGSKSWIIRYRDQLGKSKEMNLGRSDKISLELARKKARQALANLLDGEDPLQKREERREAARTSGERALQTVVEKYRASSLYLTKRDTTRRGYDNSLDRYILPKFGDMAVEDIKRRHVSEFLDELLVEHSGSVSNQARSALSVVMSFALERDLIEYNPVIGVKAKHKMVVRRRILTDDELRDLWTRLDNRQGVTWAMSRMLKLLMLLPARATEISGMHWSEVDFDAGLLTIPGERMKGHQDHELPLPPLAIDILREQAHKADTPFVFPSLSKEEPMHRARPSRACNRLSKDMSRALFGPHDLRRTIATRMAGLGIDQSIIERTLGHKVGLGRAIVHYDHHSYRDEKRVALELWQKELTQICSH